MGAKFREQESFPSIKRLISSANNYAYDDDSEDIYGILVGDDSGLTTPVDPPSVNGNGYKNDSSDGFVNEDENNQIYGTQPSSTRDHIIHEIIKNDKNYIDQLKG